MHSGIAHLPLHSGKAPAWLFLRMKLLAREIIIYMVSEIGADESLKRFADPFWFQALGCVLGFDWHSSGLTTTTCGAIKEGIKGLEHELGLFVAGGKAAAALKTPLEIKGYCEQSSMDPSTLIYASRMAAKIDNSAVQDGYKLYHHTFMFTSSGKWCVVQQGMHESAPVARRYHWLAEKVKDFVVEPHLAVCCDKQNSAVLNFVALESHDARKCSTEIARLEPAKSLAILSKLPTLNLPQRHWLNNNDIDTKRMKKIFLSTYEKSPQNFEQLLNLEGVGAKTLRALSLISELVYGVKTSIRDPARFSFAHGGKDGIPYPVDRQTYDKTISIFHEALNKSHVERCEKVKAFARLASIEKTIENKK